MSGTLLWTEPGWLARAHAWIRSELERRGRVPSGAIEQPHARPWATALRVPTDDGPVWFKASIPALAQEAAVIEVLAVRRPAAVPELLARHPELGWMLQADGGTRLREAVDDGIGLDRWQELLPRYAQLQIESAADRDALLAAGAADRTLAVLPRLLREVLADDAAVRPDVPEALSDGELARLRKVVPAVERACRELARLGLPDTIQHDDLHDGNVFVGDSGYVFFDWGDASVSHPFLSLSVTLGVLASKLATERDAPALDRVRDAYLEPWTRFRPRGELAAAVPAALWLGHITRALTWRLVVRNVPWQFGREWADGVPAHLRMLLTARPAAF